MTKSIDDWAADKCHVVAQEYVTYSVGDPESDDYYEIELPNGWTIKDPRCREIVREHFELTTYYIKLNSGKNWTCQTGDKGPYGRGKTIAEAEIACITAIYEAENGSEE